MATPPKPQAPKQPPAARPGTTLAKDHANVNPPPQNVMPKTPITPPPAPKK